MKIKKLEWYSDNNNADEELYTILAFQYPDEKCGTIYAGYRIYKLSGSVFELDFCDAHMGIFYDIETAKIAAQKHWETIIWGAINGN